MVRGRRRRTWTASSGATARSAAGSSRSSATSTETAESAGALAASPRGVHFVFDAGPTARLYLPDVATRSVRSIFQEFSGFVHAPSLVHAEVTAAWLQAVREGNLTWNEYQQYLADFQGDLDDGFLQLWRDDDLLPGVLSVQERVTRLHLENRSAVPILHTHDAYYAALVEALRRDSGQRVILVTNDARVWRCAQTLGLEVFHGNTCDLGVGRLNVGSPGHDFVDGLNCRPCSRLTCPSGFVVDLATLPRNLGSGVPRSQRERAPHTRSTVVP